MKKPTWFSSASSISKLDVHASNTTATADYVCNYLVFSVLVFSFTNSLLDVFKSLCWLVSQGRVAFPWFVFTGPGQYSPDKGRLQVSAGVPVSGAPGCTKPKDLCEGSSVSTTHLDGDLVQGAGSQENICRGRKTQPPS